MKRGILSLGNPVGEKDRKIMRITDRKYGRWVDIVIDHGTFIEMDLVYSGATKMEDTRMKFGMQMEFILILSLWIMAMLLTKFDNTIGCHIKVELLDGAHVSFRSFSDFREMKTNGYQSVPISISRPLVPSLK